MKRSDTGSYEAFCGLDLGKASHECKVVGPDGETSLMHRRVAQDEGELASLFEDVASLGRALVVLDQRAGFATLAVACAREAGLDVGWVAPSKFAQAAELYGEEKTDRRDAEILALVAIEQPRLVELALDEDEQVARARVLLRYRQDMVGERTRAYNRIHDALSRLHPALEGHLSGSGLHSRLALSLLARFGVEGLAKARPAEVARWVRRQKGFGPSSEEEAARMHDVASRPRVKLPASDVLDQTIRQDASRVLELERMDVELSSQVAELCLGLPEVGLARTMPGIGQVFSKTIALEIGNVERFRSASALAAYSGLGKCARESGKRKGRKSRRRYNRRLHSALVESARIALRHEGPDRDYYEKKLAGKMNEHQALHALARKRLTILYAMLKNKEPYRAA